MFAVGNWWKLCKADELWLLGKSAVVECTLLPRTSLSKGHRIDLCFLLLSQMLCCSLAYFWNMHSEIGVIHRSASVNCRFHSNSRGGLTCAFQRLLNACGRQSFSWFECQLNCTCGLAIAEIVNIFFIFCCYEHSLSGMSMLIWRALCFWICCVGWGKAGRKKGSITFLVEVCYTLGLNGQHMYRGGR